MRDEDKINPEFIQGQIEALVDVIAQVAEQSGMELSTFAHRQVKRIIDVQGGQIEDPNARGRADVLLRFARQTT